MAMHDEIVDLAKDALVISRRLIRITMTFFIVGVGLFASSYMIRTLFVPNPKSIVSLILEPLQHVGEAFTIASIVAFIFERLLSDERNRDLARIIGLRQAFQ